jgi:hypothetical protein
VHKGEELPKSQEPKKIWVIDPVGTGVTRSFSSEGKNIGGFVECAHEFGRSPNFRRDHSC